MACLGVYQMRYLFEGCLLFSDVVLKFTHCLFQTRLGGRRVKVHGGILQLATVPGKLSNSLDGILVLRIHDLNAQRAKGFGFLKFEVSRVIGC